MNPRFSALLLIVSGTIGYSQDKLQLGIQLCPNFSTGLVLNDAINADLYDTRESFVFSYTGGLQLDWRFADTWAFSTGLFFTKTGDKSEKIPPDPNRGFIWSWRYYQTSLYYIEIPLLINKTLGAHWNFELGINPAINIKHTYRFLYDGGNSKMNPDYYNADFIGLFVNAGLGFRVNTAINIMPCARYNILRGIQPFDLIDSLPGRHNLAFGLKIVYLF